MARVASSQNDSEKPVVVGRSDVLNPTLLPDERFACDHRNDCTRVSPGFIDNSLSLECSRKRRSTTLFLAKGPVYEHHGVNMAVGGIGLSLLSG